MRKDQGIYLSVSLSDPDCGVLFLNGDSNGFALVELLNSKEVEDFLLYVDAANDAIDEIEALVEYNEENNLYATKTYRDMVDILIRAGRR